MFVADSPSDQPFLGLAPRTHNDDQLRTLKFARKVHLLCLSEHHPIAFRLLDRLCLPLFFGTEGPIYAFDLPHQLDPLTPHPRSYNFLPCLAIWLCLSCPHRLHHLHPCKILQATPRHVPPSHHLSKIIPAL